MGSSSNDTDVSSGRVGLVSTGYRIAARFLKTPLRVVGQLRRYDNVINWNKQSTTENSSAGRSQESAQPSGPYRYVTNKPNNVADPPSPIPGPWGFLTSKYFIGLFIISFILNRVQNIVVPPRNPLAYHHRMRASPRARRTTVFSYVFASLFPIDLSSSFSRFAFRIPSIYLLGKTLLLWGVILLQTMRRFPTRDWNWLQAIGEWAGQKSMDDVCWFTFTSVCITLFVSTLTKGMEGFPDSSNYPFNLFSYSFILYLYASPAMQAEPSQGGGPPRPDRHVIITMIFPLIQLFSLHCMEIRKRWAKLRLVPTTIVGLLSLAHFHTVSWFYPSYPLPGYIPNLTESLLLAVTVFSLSLNAFTQLCLTGTISKPLLGHTSSLMPKWDEDFGMVLFRLGTASLEATSVAGLGNEVGGVGLASSGSLTQGQLDDCHGVVELTRSGVTSVTPGISSNDSSVKHGFYNEISRVKASSTRTIFFVDTVMNSAFRREAVRFSKALWHVLSGIWRYYTYRRSREPMLEPVEEDDDEASESDHEPYERFLRGDVVSDDDEAFEPALDQGSDYEEEESETDGSNEPDIAGLYADLSDVGATSSTVPVLLAHMTDASPSPLTRRRFTSLISASTQSRAQANEEYGNWDAFVQARRESKQTRPSAGSGEDHGDANLRSCVICTVEPREIICWPCRCLALCDDCRENLASRASASKHTCPCCRRNVEGYSRIYIP